MVLHSWPVCLREAMGEGPCLKAMPVLTVDATIVRTAHSVCAFRHRCHAAFSRAPPGFTALGCGF